MLLALPKKERERAYGNKIADGPLLRRHKSLLQWNLYITNGQGTSKNMFTITRFLLYQGSFTCILLITGLNKIVRYIKDFLMCRLIIYRDSTVPETFSYLGVAW